jgi:NAD(P)-dependent dehydrogenase (short-subunit alcohol dehydrogenase family)
MSNKKVWFITGASRGMGVQFAKAAVPLYRRRRCHRYGGAEDCRD